METVIRLNDAVNEFAWGSFGLVLILGAGIIAGAVMESSLVWDISDKFNGLKLRVPLED